MQDFKHLRDPYHMQHRDTAARHYDGVITDPRGRSNTWRPMLYGVIVVGQAAALAAALLFTPDRAVQPNEDYCKMTALYAQTGGEFGWPDFNNNMHLCVGEAT